MILLSLIFIVSLDSQWDFLVVTSAVFSCFNNIGPILGTTSSFSIFSPYLKILLSLCNDCRALGDLSNPTSLYEENLV